MRKTSISNGLAGFVRIDSVHQGDEDGIKGVYHPNCVDSISQWRVGACKEGINAAFSLLMLMLMLMLMLELVIDQFPLVIEGVLLL